MYMNDIKIFAKNENELKKNLIQTIRINNQDIGMESAIEKCAMLTIEIRKWETIERIELPNKESVRTLREKENYKLLGILEVYITKQTEIKKETSWNQMLQPKSDQWNKYLGSLPCKISWTLLWRNTCGRWIWQW